MSQHLIREIQQLKQQVSQLQEGWAEAQGEHPGDGGSDLRKNITNIWKLLNDINTRLMRVENIVSSNDPDETVFIEPEDELEPDPHEGDRGEGWAKRNNLR